MLKKGDIIFHAKLIFSFYFNIVVVIYIRDYTRKMRGSVNSSGRITIRGMCDFRGWPIIWYLTFDSLTCTRRASATNEPNEKLLARKSFLAKTNTKSLSLSLPLLLPCSSDESFLERKTRPRARKVQGFRLCRIPVDSSYARGKES